MGPMIKLLLLASFLAAFTINAKSQTVMLLTLDQLDERINKGKDTVYILNFWATWCGPCLQELPYFEKLTTALKGEKVKIMLVSLDFKSKLQTAVIPLANKLALRNEVFLLNEQDQQQYIERIDKTWSGALPATLFINKAQNKRDFKEKEFTYQELLQTYHLIK